MLKNKEREMTGEVKVQAIAETLAEKLKNMIDTKMVVGETIIAGDTTIVPVSKVAVGFLSGGGEYEKESGTNDFPFIGGSGAGYSVSPVGFLVIKKGDVKLIKVSPSELASKIIDVVPEVVDAINKQLKK